MVSCHNQHVPSEAIKEFWSADVDSCPRQVVKKQAGGVSKVRNIMEIVWIGVHF